MYNGYLYRLIFLFVALCFLIAYIIIVEETSVKHNARKKISSVLPLDNLPNVVDNKTESLNKFYSFMLQNIATWKTPIGYKVTRLDFQSGNDSYSLLVKNGTIKVSLKSDAKLIIGILNEKSNIYSESIIRSQINDMNVWDVSTSTHVYIKSKKALKISIPLLITIIFLVLYCKRGKGVYIFLGLLLSHFGVYVLTKSIKNGRYSLLTILELCGYVLMLLVLAAFYKVQISILSSNNSLHEIFYRQFSNYSLFAISLILSLFNHKIIVNLIFWFVWAPIVQCYVFKGYKEITSDQEQTIKSQDSGSSVNIELEDESNDGEIVAIKKRKIDFSIVLFFVHIVLTFLILNALRDGEAFKITKDIYNSVIQPFNVQSVPTYALSELHSDNNEVSIDIELKDTEAPINELYEISSTSALDPWIESVVKSTNANKTTILFKGTKDKNYTLYKEQSAQDLEEFLFIFQGDEYFTVMEVDFTRDNCNYESVNMLSFKLTWPIELRITTIIDFFTLLLCLILHHKTRKNKLRTGLVGSSLAINMGSILLFLILIPTKLFDIQKANEAEVTNAIAPIFQFMALRNWTSVFLFLNLVFLIGYVLLSVPRSYLTFNTNFTAVKRPITTNIANLLVILYQGAMLISIATCIGTCIFGPKLSIYKDYFSTLKYLFLMTFNKLYMGRKNIGLWIYYRISIVIFYIMLLTAIIATFYFGSKTKDLPEPKNFETFTDRDYNINVDIKATHKELMYFKVFLKALESYREHNKNNPEYVDSIEKFMETFTQSQTGLHRLKFNTTQHVYLERIKIHYSENKVKELEDYSKTLHLNNESRKNYLILLENKIESTMKELQRFKDSNEIIETINKARNVSKEEPPKSEEEVETGYNLEDLESFITNPNVDKKVDVVEKVQKRVPVPSVDPEPPETTNSQDAPVETVDEQGEPPGDAVIEAPEQPPTPAEETTKTNKSSEETSQELTQGSGKHKRTIKEKKPKESKTTGIFKTSILR